MLPSEAQLTLLQGFSLPPETLQEGARAANTSPHPGFYSIPVAERNVDHPQHHRGRKGSVEMPVCRGDRSGRGVFMGRSDPPTPRAGFPVLVPTLPPWGGLCGAMDERAGLLIQRFRVRVPAEMISRQVSLFF